VIKFVRGTGPTYGYANDLCATSRVRDDDHNASGEFEQLRKSVDLRLLHQQYSLVGRRVSVLRGA